jgi:hypothetical protein
MMRPRTPKNWARLAAQVWAMNFKKLVLCRPRMLRRVNRVTQKSTRASDEPEVEP